MNRKPLVVADPRFDLLPAGSFHGGFWSQNPPKKDQRDLPPKEGEVLPPLTYAPPDSLPILHDAPRPVRDEIPPGTFHESLT